MALISAMDEVRMDIKILGGGMHVNENKGPFFEHVPGCMFTISSTTNPDRVRRMTYSMRLDTLRGLYNVLVKAKREEAAEFIIYYEGLGLIQNPFDDENALRGFEHLEIAVEKGQRNVTAPRKQRQPLSNDKTMLQGNLRVPLSENTNLHQELTPPTSDDGLPDSPPSRHTLSAQSSALDRLLLVPSPLAIPRGRPLAMSLAVPSDSRLLERSHEPAVLCFQEGLLAPRDSSRMHTTFVNEPGSHISATASIHDAGEPVRGAGVAALRRPSDTLPKNNVGQARASVTSQKAPFPLLSPERAREQGAVLKHGQSGSRHPNDKVKPKTRALIIFIWRNKTRIVVAIIVVFHISLITMAAAATIAIQDSRHHVLKASSVIAGVLGAASYIASVLCGWALSLDCRREQKQNVDEDVEAGKSAKSEPRELSEKGAGNGSSQQTNQPQQASGYSSPASGSTFPRPKDAVRGPYRMQDGWINYPTPASHMEGEDSLQPRRNLPNGIYLTTPQSSQPPSTGITFPSSSGFPISAFSDLDSTPRREDSGMYRERLESRLRQREYSGENRQSEGFDSRDAEQDNRPNEDIARGNVSTLSRQERNPEQQSEHRQARRATYHYDSTERLGTQNPPTTAIQRPLSSPLILLPQTAKLRDEPRPPIPSVVISAVPEPDPTQPQPPYSAYPRLSMPSIHSHSWISSHSTTPDLTPSPTNPFEVQDRGSPFLSPPSSPSPLYTPFSPITPFSTAQPSSMHTSYPLPPVPSPLNLSHTPHSAESDESGDRAVSETSSLRAEKDLKSWQKVRVWLEFIDDGSGSGGSVRGLEGVGEGR
ncbi:hypothetical protein G7Y79_00041g077700 [Physcia stellaris]|nr:hypothetical protein G7Y79_00041g077700 [Physcia stellaris]